MTFRRCIAALCLFALPALAFADSAKLIAKSGDWQSFSSGDKNDKVCYMASQLKNPSGLLRRKTPVFFTITHRVADKSIGVVSISQGITYKKDKPVQLEVGGMMFDFYVSGESVWSRNDKAVVAALLKNKLAILHATTPLGRDVADSFSLDGFAKAYSDISKACGVPLS